MKTHGREPRRAVPKAQVPQAGASSRSSAEGSLVTSQDTIASQSLALREAEFYDHRSKTYDLVRRLIQRSMRGLERYAETHRYFDPAGKHVLLYAPVPQSVSLFERGAASVTGIDVSERELERARRAMEDAGYGDRFHGLVADAHRTPFEDASFDVIVGGSVLHHLDLPIALREIRRILRPGGRAVFDEPLAHNPLIRLGRALTPGARTPDEHPLTVDDLELCGEVFAGFEHHEFELITVPLMPLNALVPRRWSAPVAERLSRWDDAVIARAPALRRYARLTVLVLK